MAFNIFIDMKTYGIIYKTTNLINGKIYIGQTTNVDDRNYLGSGVIISKVIKKWDYII